MEFKLQQAGVTGVTPDSGIDSHGRGCSFLVLFEGVGLKEASFIGL